MPRKQKNQKRRSSDLSGIAATLLRDKIATLATPEYQKRTGELIAAAARPKQKVRSDRAKRRQP
jgi:hypothetical protein